MGMVDSATGSETGGARLGRPRQSRIFPITDTAKEVPTDLRASARPYPHVAHSFGIYDRGEMKMILSVRNTAMSFTVPGAGPKIHKSDNATIRPQKDIRDRVHCWRCHCPLAFLKRRYQVR